MTMNCIDLQQWPSGYLVDEDPSEAPGRRSNVFGGSPKDYAGGDIVRIMGIPCKVPSVIYAYKLQLGLTKV